MDQTTFQTTLYRELAKVGKGLGSDRRLALVDLLAQSPRTVEDLATLAHLSVANTSRHLQALRDAGLVVRTLRGNFGIYRLATPLVAQLFYLLRGVGEAQLPVMATTQRDYDTAQRVQTLDLPAALKLLSRDDVQLLDVRPAAEFAAGHIAGAVNVPYDRLATALDRLPADQDLIVYCRGSLCGLTNQATRYLTQQGRHAYSLPVSYYDWRVFVGQ